MKILRTLCILALAALPARAADIVVDPGGGGDALTIQAGVDLAESGDVVLVAPGVYPENVEMKSGVGLVSQSGAEVTIIDMGGGLGVNCEQCGPGTRVIGFTLTNGGGYCGGAVRIYDQSHVEVAHCIITENHTDFESAGVHVHDACSASIHDNVFSANTSYHSVCISVIVGSVCDVVDNLFIHNTSTFLSAGVGVNASQCYLEGNVFYKNVSVNGAAVRCWNGALELQNNTFIRNSSETEAADVSCLAGGPLVMDRNLFAYSEGGPAVLSDYGPIASCNTFWGYDADGTGMDGLIGTNGNVIQDPLLCLSGTEEGALSDYSPCLTGPCAVVGANPEPSCQDAVPTTSMSWGDVKSLFD